MADHLCVRGQAKQFIKVSRRNMTARACSQSVKRRPFAFHLDPEGMRHTRFKAPSNTNQSAFNEMITEPAPRDIAFKV